MCECYNQNSALTRSVITRLQCIIIITIIALIVTVCISCAVSNTQSNISENTHPVSIVEKQCNMK